MSRWFKVKAEDLEIDGDELNMYVTSDDDGAIYATVKLELLEKLGVVNNIEGEKNG